jgi:hypothetical protein
MSDVMSANGEIADAVAQTGLAVLGGAAAQGLASQYLVGAHASGLSIQNATAHQRQGNVLGAAATTQAAVQILTSSPARVARATKEILGRRSLLTEMASLAAAARRLRRATPGPNERLARMAAAPPPGTHDTVPKQAARSELEPLVRAAEAAAEKAKALARTWQESHSMGENQSAADWTEALNRFRAALDELGGALEAAASQLKESVDADLGQRLKAAAQDLRNAAGQFRPIPPASPIPAGATQPGVVIVGSGNVSATLPAPRIVGASW